MQLRYAGAPELHVRVMDGYRPGPQGIVMVGIMEADGHIQEPDVRHLLQQPLVPFPADQAVAYPVPHFLKRPEEAHIYALFRRILPADVQQPVEDRHERGPGPVCLQQHVQVYRGSHVPALPKTVRPCWMTPLFFLTSLHSIL